MKQLHWAIQFVQNLALVHRPAILLASWRAGKIAGYLGTSFSTLTLHLRLHPALLESALLHGHTCWAAGLRARCALAALATWQTVLAIAHGDRLPRFIIIVQTLDDVTCESVVAIIAHH